MAKSTLAIKANGTLWSWGSNSHGQLGLGSLTSYSSPVQVGALTTWSSVSAGIYCALAIKTDGTLWSWGQGANAQLGLGNTSSYSSPVQVGALTDWASVSASASNNGSVVATKTDGTLWAWGTNAYGQQGHGNTTTYSSPVQVGALTTWLNACSGNYFTVASKTDGTLWTCGQNNLGQLGHNNTTDLSSPVQVGALTDWVVNAGTGGFKFCSVVKPDGTLWTWGDNGIGQLGHGNYINVSSPKQVGALTSWSNAVSRNGNSSFLTTTGLLFACGYSNQGGLGLGATNITTSPIQVGALTSWVSIFPANAQGCFAIQS
jgi:alpha-tubulin suppressor-like RCC1 family protein